MPTLNNSIALMPLAVLAAGLALVLVGHVPAVEATGYVAPFVFVIDKPNDRHT